MKCEHYPHVHTLIPVPLRYIPTQSLSANVYNHTIMNTIQFYYYTFTQKHIHSINRYSIDFT